MTGKQAAMKVHQELVRSGWLIAARMVYRLLVSGKVTLGISENCAVAEMALELAGFKPVITHNGSWFTFFLDRMRSAA